jgi:nucleotide-binding universal stress UspA family protein
MTVQRIVVGVDGSANARRALAWSMDLAAALGAEIVAVHSVGLLAHPHPGETVPAASVHGEIEHLFETEWTAPLSASGLPSRRVLRDGTPVQVIIDVADEVQADLIVLGSRGVGGFPEQLLGSTSHQVAEHTAIPVVIIPPDHRR